MVVTTLRFWRKRQQLGTGDKRKERMSLRQTPASDTQRKTDSVGPWNLVGGYQASSEAMGNMGCVPPDLRFVETTSSMVTCACSPSTRMCRPEHHKLKVILSLSAIQGEIHCKQCGELS